MSAFDFRNRLQFEIAASLSMVAFAGLAVIAVVMGSMASRVVEDAALDRLRMGSRYIERFMLEDQLKPNELALRLRATDPESLGGEWFVYHADQRLAGGHAEPPTMTPELHELLVLASTGQEVLRSSGFAQRDLWIGLGVRAAQGSGGVLLGRVSREELRTHLRPLLQSGAWVLVVGSLVVLVFGTYLLRQRIVRPVQRLSRLARAVTDGNWAARAAVEGEDELAELANHLNAMTESLTEQRQALVRAQRSIFQNERLASVGQLSAGIAHEVGNPIAAILGFTEVLLRSDSYSAEHAQILERVRDEALRVRTLVRDILDLTRPQTLQRVEINPNELLQRLVERVSAQPDYADLALQFSATRGLPSIYVDTGRVEQILSNLIENAAHAVRDREESTVRVWAALVTSGDTLQRRRTDASRHAVTIFVEDNGPGISVEDQPHLYDPFFTRKDPGEGTGLGLWNAHRLALLMDGSLDVESSPGRTVFSLTLPAADTSEGKADDNAADSDH